MENDSNITQEISDALKEFEAKAATEGVKAQKQQEETVVKERVGMAESLMKHSGGVIKSTRQAEILLLVFVFVALGISVYLFFFSGPGANVPDLTIPAVPEQAI